MSLRHVKIGMGHHFLVDIRILCTQATGKGQTTLFFFFFFCMKKNVHHLQFLLYIVNSLAVQFFRILWNVLLGYYYVVRLDTGKSTC